MSVRVDQQLSDDLEVLMTSGMTASDATRFAIAFMAHSCRWMWSAGLYPDGVLPPRMAMKIPASDTSSSASDGRPTGEADR